MVFIINKFNLNINPKRITYDEYIEVHKNIINEKSNNINNDDLTKLINSLNDLNINENKDNNSENKLNNNNRKI